MRGLAEYVMSGRLQAATVAVLFGLIPGLSVVSGAVVALVILRRGLQDGIQILLWAMLPPGLQWLLGDPSPAFVLVGVVLASLVLRKTQSWQMTSVLIMLAGVLLQLSLPLQQTYIAHSQEIMDTLVANGLSLQVVVDGEVVTATSRQLVDALLRFYGGYQMLMMLGCMLLGRYWQALLYNPGGFRQEFHNLRFDRRLMGVLLVLVALGVYGVSPLNDWLMMFCMVPILNGLAVVHSVVAQRKMGTTWVILAYLLLFIAAPAYVLLGFVDSAIDIRKRLPAA
ncbi:MAG: hypothetical protein V4603_11735 [Pseudomonadota bacterium]